MLKCPWLSSTHSCDRASVSPFCKMVVKWHDLVGWLGGYNEPGKA